MEYSPNHDSACVASEVLVTNTEAAITCEQSRSGEIDHEGAKTLWVFGPLPPPVTGMTLATSRIVEALEAAGPVQAYNWSPGMTHRSLRMRLLRNLRMMRSIALLVARGRVRNERLYLVANSASGLFSTALIVYFAKRLGYTIYLHHHVYFYIDEYDRRMAWIVREMGPLDVHIVHNRHMIEDFRSRYPITKSEFRIVYPSIVVGDIGTPRDAPCRPMRIGLLSNLSAAKGLAEVIATFEKLIERRRDVTLTLAGPVVSSDSQRLIDVAVAKYPGCVTSLGPVYDDDKRKFFASIDVFLFPTKTEAWGVVVNEALAAGVPLITYDRGCLAMVVGENAGLLLERDTAFAAPAAAQIERWIDDRDSYHRASEAAIAQAERLRDDGQRFLDEFVQHIFSRLPPATALG
jgi:glycosyltransferase involved in cell wall biosynthesis